MRFDLCMDCRRRFLDDCLYRWVRKQQSANEVIGGYRRAELAYSDEYDYGGPSECDRCGDADTVFGGHRNYVVLPGGDENALCYECYQDWQKAADVFEQGRGWRMSPAAVAEFQWSGVESQEARRWRRMKAEHAASKQQGDKCADCGNPHGSGGIETYLVPWPWEMPDGFVMVCHPCAESKEEAAGVEA